MFCPPQPIEHPYAIKTTTSGLLTRSNSNPSWSPRHQSSRSVNEPPASPLRSRSLALSPISWLNRWISVFFQVSFVFPGPYGEPSVARRTRRSPLAVGDATRPAPPVWDPPFFPACPAGHDERGLAGGCSPLGPRTAHPVPRGGPCERAQHGQGGVSWLWLGLVCNRSCLTLGSDLLLAWPSSISIKDVLQWLDRAGNGIRGSRMDGQEFMRGAWA